MSKVLEKVVYNRLYNYLSNHSILNDSQYGFRSHHSTSNATSELIGNIIHGFERKEFTLGVFLDLSKAFDTVNHKILLNKLEHYDGVRGTNLDWFQSYLCNRKQYVHFKGCNSKIETTNCVVPQGSVL